ncbi:DNA-binding response regulator [Mergibacter septicus]|uniref:Transcriptional regulatory protein CpxR n=1 Tax=Mergibacter septicus TaxID=221402 RepID=A0A8D4J109_9PAST|nr:envelope stress response regulator transcription factor CpxR [Mergibacter septicus]AWX14035.1 DNA-binding response regulator [Mergibacter septicus]AWX16054.1 DNA-binding response regulator [Mergibacter septicus]QDJ13506.1 DNA-binding response regulator [Mergibacter septicus]QDJ15307.1 DNA-binding response regulator [Mergibacter septicus]UTU48825.1 envelope stress response regulator transcription factor CpxR [Mergibacter septicus]
MSKILLVDDDIELTELLAEVLSMEGFEIDIVRNGEEALTKLDISYDLILLDIMMPVLNGVETLKRIRQKYSTPVLMLTARGDDIDRVLGLELGADDYLPKPFNDRELVARIKAVLRRSSMKMNSPVSDFEINNCEERKQVEFNGIVLYPGRQQATYHDQDLDLTGTEFALLQILMRNPGQILSRELLSLEILGKRLTPFDRAIDMHMSNLRKKLPARDDNQPWFKTLRGRGYLLVSEK